MNAQYLLSQLSYGEFSNLAVGNDGNGTINKANLGKVITYINDGLLALAIRFKLHEKVVHIQLYDHITNYHLLSRFAESQQPQPDVPFPYIQDSNRTPFKGDVLKITAVWDSRGRERQLNDETDLRSVFTLKPDMITVPYPEDDNVLFIHYSAKPQPVTTDNLNEELDIPDFLVPALRMFVAQKVFMSIGSGDNMRIAQDYQSQYSALLNDIQHVDALSDSRFVHGAFENRGWC